MIDKIKQDIENRADSDAIKRGLYERSLRTAACFNESGRTDASGIPILGREKSSQADPNVKTASDFVNLIGTEKAGYLAHDIQRIYEDDIDESVKEKYKDYDRVNSTGTINSEIMEADAIMGNCFALLYVYDGEVRKKKIQPYTASVFYNKDSGEAEYAYIYDVVEERVSDTTTVVKRVYIYDTINRMVYEERSYDKETSPNRWLLRETAPHGFTEVPVIEFANNNKKLGNAQKAISYIDAYDRVLSDATTEQSASRQAYLMMKEAGKVDEAFMERLIKFGVITVDGEGDAKWLEKNLNPQFATLVLEQLEKNIYRFGVIVNNDKLMGLSNPRKNQIEFIYRAMDNDCDTTEKQWQSALEREDRVLKSFWTTAAIPSVGDYETYNIEYVFNRNKPQDPIADLEAYERAGIKLPNKEKLILAGYDEKRAEELSAEAEDELMVSVGAFDDTSESEDDNGDN